MLGEIQVFIDRLRNQERPPQTDVSRISPEIDRFLRDSVERSYRALIESIDRFEDYLSSLYAAGADDHAAIERFDLIVSIIRRKGLTDLERLQEIDKIVPKAAGG